MLEQAYDWYDDEQRSQPHVTKGKHQNQELPDGKLQKHVLESYDRLEAAEPLAHYEPDASDTLLLPGHQHSHLEVSEPEVVHPQPQFNSTFRDDQTFFQKDGPEGKSPTSSKEGETRRKDEHAEGAQQITSPAPATGPEALFNQSATPLYAGNPALLESSKKTSKPCNRTENQAKPQHTAKTLEHGGPTFRAYSTNKDNPNLNNQTVHISALSNNPPNASESQFSSNLGNLSSHHALSPGALAGLSLAMLFLISIPIISAIVRCRRRRKRNIDVTFEDKDSNVPESEQSSNANLHQNTETGPLSPCEIQDFMKNVAAFKTQQPLE